MQVISSGTSCQARQCPDFLATVQRIAIWYGIIVLSVFLFVCDVGVLWPNGLMDEDVTWHGGRPRSQPHCVRWGNRFPPKKGSTSPHIRPMSVLDKQLDGVRCLFKRIPYISAIVANEMLCKVYLLFINIQLAGAT